MSNEEREMILWADQFVPRRRDPGIGSRWICPMCGGEGTAARSDPIQHKMPCDLVRWEFMVAGIAQTPLPMSVGEVIKNECFQRAVEHGAEMRVLDAIRSLDVAAVLTKEAGSEKKDMSEESAWLIEKPVRGQPFYFTGLYADELRFSSDSLSALRFSRKVDAERFLTEAWLSHKDCVGATVTEHAWI